MYYQKNKPDLLSYYKKISEQTNHSEKINKRAILHFTTDQTQTKYEKNNGQQ